MPIPSAELATELIHVDSPAHAPYRQEGAVGAPVAAPLVTSTTFRAPHPATDLGARLAYENVDWKGREIDVYSRYDNETRHRAEQVLSRLHGHEAHALLFASGLAAAQAAICHFAPTVVAIRKGYPGVHGFLRILGRACRSLSVIDLDEPYPTVSEGLLDIPHTDQKRGGLLVWVETPLNPTGEARDIQHYADKAHAAGGYLVVDSTFAPPPLQNPLEQGADLVMHSATKFLAGHSDALIGALVARSKNVWDALFDDRINMGGVPGNLETYLLLRSLRTLPVRINQQARSAQTLAQWLYTLTPQGAAKLAPEDEHLGHGKVLDWVFHASLQPWTETATPFGRQLESPGFDPAAQMKGGFSPCFSVHFTTRAVADHLAFTTEFFTPATSLGGVESLLEQRVVVNPSEDPGVIRVSIGLEAVADLKADLRAAFEKLLK